MPRATQNTVRRRRHCPNPDAQMDGYWLTHPGVGPQTNFFWTLRTQATFAPAHCARTAHGSRTIGPYPCLHAPRHMVTHTGRRGCHRARRVPRSRRIHDYDAQHINESQQSGVGLSGSGWATHDAPRPTHTSAHTPEMTRARPSAPKDCRLQAGRVRV